MAYKMRAQNGSATPEHPLSQRHRNQSQNARLLADTLLDSELSYGPVQPREGKGFCPSAFSPLDSMATTTVRNQLDREVGVCSDGMGCMGNLVMGEAEPALLLAQMVAHVQLFRS